MRRSVNETDEIAVIKARRCCNIATTLKLAEENSSNILFLLSFNTAIAWVFAVHNLQNNPTFRWISTLDLAQMNVIRNALCSPYEIHRTGHIVVPPVNV